MKNYMDLYNGCKCSAENGESCFCEYLDSNKKYVSVKVEHYIYSHNNECKDIASYEVDFVVGNGKFEPLGVWEFCNGKLVE